MNISIEISLYPLEEDFKKIIKGFIKKLKSYKKLDVIHNNISTQISGEYDLVFDILKNEIKPIFDKHKSVFVFKLLSGNKVKD